MCLLHFHKLPNSHGVNLDSKGFHTCNPSKKDIHVFLWKGTLSESDHVQNPSTRP